MFELETGEKCIILDTDRGEEDKTGQTQKEKHEIEARKTRAYRHVEAA